MNEIQDCSRCGNCARVCTLTSLGKGAEESVLDMDPYLCSNCWKCLEVCPGTIDIYSIIMEARRNIKMPESFMFSLESILETGYSMPMEGVEHLREMFGLGKVRPVAGEKIKKLLK